MDKHEFYSLQTFPIYRKRHSGPFKPLPFRFLRQATRQTREHSALFVYEPANPRLGPSSFTKQPTRESGSRFFGLGFDLWVEVLGFGF